MRIDLAGFGPGEAGLVTGQVLNAIAEADLIITSARLSGYLSGMGGMPSLSMAEAVCADVTEAARADVTAVREKAEEAFGSELAAVQGNVVRCKAGAGIHVETRTKDICRILEETACEYAVCLFSGDSTFFSGAAPLYELLKQSERIREKGAKIRILPGISSIVYACSCMGLSYQDIEVFSAHGRDQDVVRAVMNGKITAFLTSGSKGPAMLCENLVRAGLGSLPVTVLEMLSLPEERIRRMTAREAAVETFHPLSVLFAEPAPGSEILRRSVPGIPDEAFVRGVVPMTKQMVRVCALSMLNPGVEDLCWDLGAGTGSVSVELARLCRRVVCVEKNPEAVRLMEENRERFGAWNMEIVTGEIPGILDSLPLPDRVFLGGGGRWIGAILSSLQSRCRDRKLPVICASAITLETLHEVTCRLEDTGYETSVRQISVADVKKRGEYHMLEAQNPVYLILGKMI